MLNYTYVDHSHGEYEGTKYDKVVLSDGTFGLVVRNDTKLSEFPFKEGDTVKPTFVVKGSKSSTPSVVLTKLEKA